jgi:hypothetical protein
MKLLTRVRRCHTGLPADTPHPGPIAWLRRLGRARRQRGAPRDPFAGIGEPLSAPSLSPPAAAPRRFARWQADREQERGYCLDRRTRW